MAEQKEDLKIENGVATWEMRMDGTVAGTYVGVFKFRCYLTPTQRIAAGTEQRALLGSNMALADVHESFLAYALTQLKQRIVSAPPFWTSANPTSSLPGDIPDEEIIEAVLDAAIRAELLYKQQLKDKKEASLVRANKGVEIIEEKQKDEEEDLNEEDENQENSDNA